MNNQSQPQQQQQNSEREYAPLLKDYAQIKEKNSALLNVMNYADQYSKKEFLTKITSSSWLRHLPGGFDNEKEYVNEFAKKSGIAEFSPYVDFPFMKGMKTSSERAITLSAQENARSNLEKLYEDSILTGDFRTARDAMNQLKMVRDLPVYLAEGSSQHKSMQKVLLDIAERSAYKTVAPVNSRAIQSFYRNMDTSDSDAISHGIMSLIYPLADVVNRISKAKGYFTNDPNTYLPTPSFSGNNEGMDDRSLSISNSINSGALVALSLMSTGGINAVRSLGFIKRAGLTLGASYAVPEIKDYIFEKGLNFFSQGTMSDNQKQSFRSSVFNDLFTMGVYQQVNRMIESTSGATTSSTHKSNLKNYLDDVEKNVSSSTELSIADSVFENGVNKTTLMDGTPVGSVPLNRSVPFDADSYARAVERSIVVNAYEKINSLAPSDKHGLDWITSRISPKFSTNATILDALNNGIAVDIMPLSNDIFLPNEISKISNLSSNTSLSQDARKNQFKKAFGQAAILSLTNGKDAVEHFVPDNDFTPQYDMIQNTEGIVKSVMNDLYGNIMSEVKDMTFDVSNTMRVSGNLIEQFQSVEDKLNRKVFGSGGDSHADSKTLISTTIERLKDINSNETAFEIIKDALSNISSLERKKPNTSEYGRSIMKKSLEELKGLCYNAILNIFGKDIHGKLVSVNGQYAQFRGTGIDSAKDYLINNTENAQIGSKEKSKLTHYPYRFQDNMKEFAENSALFSPQEKHRINADMDQLSRDLITYEMCNTYTNEIGIKPDKFLGVKSNNLIMHCSKSLNGNAHEAKLEDLFSYGKHSADYYSKSRNPSGTAISMDTISELNPNISNLWKTFKKFTKDGDLEEFIRKLVYDPTTIQRVIACVLANNKN